jgi:hypothetical protein
MKTKNKTLIAIWTLAILGLINIQAISDNKKVINTEITSAKTEILNVETIAAEDLFIQSAEEMTALEADAQIEKYANQQVELSENNRDLPEFLDTAEIYTATGADQEIEKYARKLVLLQNTKTGK